MGLRYIIGCPAVFAPVALFGWGINGISHPHRRGSDYERTREGCGLLRPAAGRYSVPRVMNAL